MSPTFLFLFCLDLDADTAVWTLVKVNLERDLPQEYYSNTTNVLFLFFF